MGAITLGQYWYTVASKTIVTQGLQSVTDVVVAKVTRFRVRVQTISILVPAHVIWRQEHVGFMVRRQVATFPRVAISVWKHFASEASNLNAQECQESRGRGPPDESLFASVRKLPFTFARPWVRMDALLQQDVSRVTLFACLKSAEAGHFIFLSGPSLFAALACFNSFDSRTEIIGNMVDLLHWILGGIRTPFFQYLGTAAEVVDGHLASLTPCGVVDAVSPGLDVFPCLVINVGILLPGRDTAVVLLILACIAPVDASVYPCFAIVNAGARGRGIYSPSPAPSVRCRAFFAVWSRAYRAIRCISFFPVGACIRHSICRRSLGCCFHSHRICYCR